MTEPCSPGWHRRSSTGVSGQIRDRYTALCPEPVILATLVSNDSERTTPTSPYAREQIRHAKRHARANENRAAASRRSNQTLNDATGVRCEDEFGDSKPSPFRLRASNMNGGAPRRLERIRQRLSRCFLKHICSPTRSFHSCTTVAARRLCF